MEEPLLNSARRKMELLAASLPAGRSPILYHSHAVKSSSQSSNQVPACTRFIEEGIRELIQARRILCGSYVYGYYLEDNGYNKTIFEFMQVNFLVRVFDIFNWLKINWSFSDFWKINF